MLATRICFKLILSYNLKLDLDSGSHDGNMTSLQESSFIFHFCMHVIIMTHAQFLIYQIKNMHRTIVHCQTSKQRLIFIHHIIRRSNNRVTSQVNEHALFSLFDREFVNFASILILRFCLMLITQL